MADIENFLRFVWFWLAFLSNTCFFFIKLLAESSMAVRFRDADRSLVAHGVATQWGRAFFSLVPGWSYEIKGVENLPSEGQAAVVIANHASAVDICAIFATGMQFRWLSKDAVFKIPLIGTAMRWAGYVPITRGNPDSHAQAMAQSAEWLRRGVSMLFFPEGTRSTSGVMGRFKTGAFRLAQAENVGIIPIALIGTNRLMKARSLVPRKAHVIIQVLPMVRQGSEESLEQFADRCKDIIQSSLDEAYAEPEYSRDSLVKA